MPKANGDNSGAWLWLGQPISRQSGRRIPQLHANDPQQSKRNMLINATQPTSPRLARYLENLPSTESLNAFWDGEEGTSLRNKIFRVTRVRKYFRNCQSLGATDIDGCHRREHILCLFANNDTELHQLIIDELIFPYVMGEFLPLFLPELCGGPSVSQERWRSSTSSVRDNLAPMHS